jgi:hypothetical protein
MLAGLGICLFLAAQGRGQDVTEPKSGVTFAAKSGDMSLLGVGVRTRTMLKVKVYAVGLYAADSALAGPLAAHKANVAAPSFYKDLVSGDFEKQVVMKFVRDVSTDQIRGAFRESLKGAEGAKVDLFVGYFSDTKVGQEYVLRWAPGGILETKVAGLNKPPITDEKFAAAVFGIWLGEKPIQEDIKKGLVSRAGALLEVGRHPAVL